MRINVKAKPNSKHESIEKIDENNFIVCVKEEPRQGRANLAIRNALAVYFKTGTSNVKIISGHTSRNKIIDIMF
ncbi:MAG: hypothetical protein A2312_00890 [Candidatus Staskawiczbacteria bacterium RIFOXYB2_FULL_32_9]|uniref:Uncharacterized protein n=1 Tax=Candidatus Staskawiczbacteria bacterium RIFOXYD1_FULL_32_13 TaxID=1802234 RepID=A0A1G2JKQ0_9BACT|nr:MAG: hypothetical protein UR22_C0001G0048 [Parcubacteria group bacterium GW2011_GWC2_32_10]OGZ78254.1 MAG: hypothetical protein A2360_03725 [Candidatus Staskawiczbacteria bacterium RIFOXYB1_FULL_32_11]OGZ84469.1 MAG: hypothetical protein A2312_00890 [Candidatus Staskawiczbacteria bacterium RIFOXYB2_FULL_32_9]OGZ85146.1 MAG: hypothetical protein A2463_00035 [Candidatus Staskawiczbacteria bacterium RIFOXYC2_FULL_32_10]OGZ87684.1 MAG: hypothetical protein A2561_03245 [Candidatus Staskawiczbacte